MTGIRSAGCGPGGGGSGVSEWFRVRCKVGFSVLLSVERFFGFFKCESGVR